MRSALTRLEHLIGTFFDLVCQDIPNQYRIGTDG